MDEIKQTRQRKALRRYEVGDSAPQSIALNDIYKLTYFEVMDYEEKETKLEKAGMGEGSQTEWV